MLLGRQRPRVSVLPRGEVGSDAPDAVDLASAYGLVPDEWQQRVLRAWLARRAGGKWLASRCGLSVPRQNGKNGALEVRELFGMAMLGEKFLHTAHEVKTARKAFRRLLSFFENERQFPELAELVTEIRKTNGQEAIVLANGGSVEFVARSKGSGRGFTVDVLVCDEAQDLTDDDLAALLPTISAAPLRNPQTILTGTPPAPNMNGEVFSRWREDALSGESRRLAWQEWSVDRPKRGDAPLDLDSLELTAEANPGLGIRLLADTIADERASMDAETFMRERWGMWHAESTDGADVVVTVDEWAERVDSRPENAPQRMGSLAVEVDLARSFASIGAAGKREDGRTHVELVERRRGTRWVVDRCVELEARHGSLVFVIDGGGPAADLQRPLEDAGLYVVTLGTKDVAAAAAWLVDAVRDDRLRHGPQGEVDDAVAGAKKRTLGDGLFAIGRRKSDADVTPLVAVTLAGWFESCSSDLNVW